MSDDFGPPPRYGTAPTPGAAHRLAAFEKLAGELGLRLMPWQRGTIRVGTEYDEATGVPFYREMVVAVPRQSGKSSLALIWALERCLLRGKPQTVIYTAQTGHDARKKFQNDFVPIIEGSRLGSAVKRISRAAGFEAVEFRNGSRFEVQPTTPGAGHGRTVDLGIIDEAWADQDERRELTLVPAMAARADAQLLVLSTAGSESSMYWRRKVDQGRAAVKRQKDR
ncbi:MAG: phage terminase family protein [Actinomycetota bacterium]|nr:phage terminase family protein [Actinomycetota bacterium]